MKNRLFCVPGMFFLVSPNDNRILYFSRSDMDTVIVFSFCPEMVYWDSWKLRNRIILFLLLKTNKFLLSHAAGGVKLSDSCNYRKKCFLEEIRKQFTEGKAAVLFLFKLLS